jgi:hypothetical protein
MNSRLWLRHPKRKGGWQSPLALNGEPVAMARQLIGDTGVFTNRTRFISTKSITSK